MSKEIQHLDVTVVKRDGQLTTFDASKIELALMKCYMSKEVYGPDAAQSDSIRAKAKNITLTVVQKIQSEAHGSINIERIQDLVEMGLMMSGDHKAAREYVIFRNNRNKERLLEEQIVEAAPVLINIKRADASTYPLNRDVLVKLVTDCSVGLPDVDVSLVVDSAIKNLYDNVTQAELDEAMELAARQYIETDPDYTYLAARMALVKTRRQVYGILKIVDSDDAESIAEQYRNVLFHGLHFGVKEKMFTQELIDGRFNIETLGQAIKSERDFQFDYLGYQTLYDRYFYHSKKIRYELPQTFLMRVAMGLSIYEDNPTLRAIQFYEKLSTFDLMSSTPTLFNSGGTKPQMSSCFLTQVPDDLHGIFGAIQDNAMLSKFAGGIGNDWTTVRGMGSHIQGTNGESQGVVPFMKVANDTAVAVNQGGKRKGAVCGFLETWHIDIEAFLDLRKNTGDDRRRTHDMNTANWVPDLFMERVIAEGYWSLFSPEEAPELHELYGLEFKAKYEEYERKGEAGELLIYRKLEAKTLWRKMLAMLFETGHPWITFKDPCNIRSPQQHVGVVHSSNLCTEITLNTKANEEIAVCNLASVNVVAHITDGKIDKLKLKETITTAMRMLDNVIDSNYYTVQAAATSNKRHRPVALGLMGFQDALHVLGIPYDSIDAIEFSDRLMEVISYYAIEASADLAQERGSYSSFEGSLWSIGILPIDSIDMLAMTRETPLLMDTHSYEGMDWNALRIKVQKGMRNSNTMAIAPTATIANIIGVTQSIEPTFQNLYVKSNMSGDFTFVDKYLAKELKSRGLWDPAMVQDLKYYDGSLSQITRVPEELKRLYAIAWEISPNAIIECGSRRQKWIDQSQSLNLYMRDARGKSISDAYMLAYKLGLKTTYYLRTQAATSTEKTTIVDNKLNAVKSAISSPSPISTAPNVCSIQDPTCEACQ